MNSMQTTGDEVVYPWEFELSGEIQEFHIWYSQCIDAIMFVYKDNNNKIINSPRFGSKAGGSVYVVTFAPEDYILGVRGSLGFVDGIPVVGGFQWLTTRGWGKSVSTPGAVGSYDLSLDSGDKRLRFYGNYGTKYLHSFGFAAAPHTNSDNGFGEQPMVPEVPRYITKKEGPFGGRGGANSWEFKFASQIREIDIRCGTCVDSITFHFRNNENQDRSSKKFGGSGGGLKKVRLADNEKIIGISGTFGVFAGYTVITSISFTTPLRTYGPFGMVKGTTFSTHIPQAMITEFYGNYGQYLDSIGVVFFVNPDANINNGFGEQSVVPAVPQYITEKDGPFGGPGGATPWEFKFANQIREIDIRCGSCVDSIIFHFRNNENQDCSSKKIGGSGGSLKKVRLDDNEKIIGISGTFGDFAGHNVITSISFATPLRTYGPFGTVKGTTFSSHRPQAMITEFYGNYGQYLDSIGAVFLINHDANINNGYVRELVEAQVEKNPAYVIAKDGPFGGDGANSWEFSFPDKVREIHIWSDKYINSIMFVYRDNDNKDVNSQRFGGDGGNLNKVTLRDDDFLTGFGGSYGDFEGNIVIMSIRFQTTQWRKQFGSINQGSKFDVVRTGPLKLIKFHGNYGTYLHSIGGVYDINGKNINGSETTKDKTIDNDKNNGGISRLPTTKDGPFGGPGGVFPWEFRPVGEIREIHIWSAHCVLSIMFVYKDNENKDRCSQRYGGHGGNLQKVILAPNDHVIGISGTSGVYYGNMVITSISFETPQTTYGPYGTIQGTKFSTVATQAKAIEFYGRYGLYIHSIGLGFLNDGIVGEVSPGENIPTLPSAKDGPFGGPNGVSPWEFKYVEKIREILIWSASCVDSLVFIYRDNDNKDRTSQKFGGNSGNLHKIKLADSEHIIGINGTFGPFLGNTVITSISFETSRRTYGPYGRTQGTSFATSSPRAKLTKFYGRYGHYLESIGAVFLKNGTDQDEKEELSKGTGQDEKEGPSKGEINRDGQLWDLKFVGEIREIYVRSGSGLDSMKFHNLQKVTEK